jgi:hypothetical protein
VGAIEPAASTAASLLARGSFSGGHPAVPGLAALVDGTLPHRPDLREAFERARAQPEDPTRVGALAQALTALAETDTAFGRELAALITQAQQAPGVGGLVTQVHGHAQVGTLVTIGQAGDLHLHLPPEPTPTVLDQLPPTRPGPLVANLPPRNQVFTGRADLLDQLDQRLHPGQAAAVVQVQAQTLHGLGGVGKTQLALEYAHRHAGDYELVWWVAAEQPAAIPSQLVALARRLGLPEAAEQAETVGALWDALRQRHRWLLIFDNAEHPTELRPWVATRLRAGAGHLPQPHLGWPGCHRASGHPAARRGGGIPPASPRPRRPSLRPARGGAWGPAVGVGAGRRLPRGNRHQPRPIPQPARYPRA